MNDVEAAAARMDAVRRLNSGLLFGRVQIGDLTLVLADWRRMRALLDADNANEPEELA